MKVALYSPQAMKLWWPRSDVTLQIAESSELVGEVEDLASLEKEYARDDLIYQEKIRVSDNPGW